MTKINMQEKSTLILINTVGFPVARQIKVQRAEVNDGRLTLQYVEKGKQKPVATRFDADTEMALYNGWHNVKGAINNSGEWEQYAEDAFTNMRQQINQVAVWAQPA